MLYEFQLPFEMKRVQRTAALQILHSRLRSLRGPLYISVLSSRDAVTSVLINNEMMSFPC